MKINIEIDESELRRLVFEHIRSKLGDAKINPKHVKIQVKSKQNYKSEWEEAAFRAVYEHYDA